MRHITQNGLALIKQFEGFMAEPYLCPGGYWTIGYGHVIQNPKDYPYRLTRDEGLELLAKDVMIAERAVLRLISVPLTQGQFDALVSFTFNLGAGALQRSTLRRKVNREEHADVPAEFRKWVWAGGRKMNGLIKRRKAEAELYLGNATVLRFAA
jgi:GH24 family phage-related lysozyme (muramidase)